MCARYSLLRTLAAAVVLLGGCNSALDDPPPPPDIQPVTFTLSPSNATIEEGQTLQLTVTVTDADGNRLAATGISWSTSDQNVARLVGPGKVQGQSTGTALIAAAWQGSSDQADVQVIARRSCPPLLRASRSAVPCPVR